MPDPRRVPEPRGLSESPWFWVYLFATAALAALYLASFKYGPRQAEIERRYQGLERAAELRQGAAPATPVSGGEALLVTLRPLYWLLGVALLIGWVALWWTRFRATPRGER